MAEKQFENSRRRFLNSGVRLGAMMPFFNPLFSSPDQKVTNNNERVKPLKILILGGTSFLGPQQIAYALERGHSISTFTRGKTVPTTKKDVFNNVEQLIGDRENDLNALKGRKWDAVIDNSGQRVKWVKDTVNLLKDNSALYLFTSSTGVYYPYLGNNIKEETKPVLEVPEGITKVQSFEYGYGVMKANSEIETINAFGKDRSIIVRPTYMMGPGDQTDRFTYWPVRISQGGEIMVPGKQDDPVQYIDVRDVAQWMIRLIESGITGVFNAAGPASATDMHAFIYGVHAATNSKVSFISIPDYDFLKRNNIMDAIPWIMPVEDNFGSARVNNQLAVDNGLTFTALAESCRDIITWWNSGVVPEERMNKILSGEDSLHSKEKAIIAAWKRY